MATADEIITGYIKFGIPEAPGLDTLPSIQLAVLLYNLCGRPAAWRGAAYFQGQIKTLAALRKLAGFERVRDVIDWVFHHDEWKWDSLIVTQADPSKYFSEKFASDLEPKFLGWKMAEDKVLRRAVPLRVATAEEWLAKIKWPEPKPTPVAVEPDIDDFDLL